MPRQALDWGHASEIALAILGYNPLAEEYTPGQWTGQLTLSPATYQAGRGWLVAFRLTRRLTPDAPPATRAYQLQISEPPGGPGSLQLYWLTDAGEQRVDPLCNLTYVTRWLIQWGYWVA